MSELVQFNAVTAGEILAAIFDYGCREGEVKTDTGSVFLPMVIKHHGQKPYHVDTSLTTEMTRLAIVMQGMNIFDDEKVFYANETRVNVIPYLGVENGQILNRQQQALYALLNMFSLHIQFSKVVGERPRIYVELMEREHLEEEQAEFMKRWKAGEKARREARETAAAIKKFADTVNGSPYGSTLHLTDIREPVMTSNVSAVLELRKAMELEGLWTPRVSDYLLLSDQ